MIPVNELRIGNWYKTKSDNIRFVQIGYGYDIDYVSIYCDPIPITPEILEKCGFVVRYVDSENINSWIEWGTNVILNQYKNDNSYFYLYPALWYPTQHIKYLHQLQNLYFALTGQELKINL